MPATILKTKLYIPPARPNMVGRPQLTGQIEAGLHRKLTLISAPPGFGKTTLLGEWIRSRDALSPLTVAWLSLDEADNDLVRFWTYVISALNGAQPALGGDALDLLMEPQSPPIEDILALLINAGADLPHKTVLVLDDYHLIQSDAIHSKLTFLMDHMPPQMHLMLTSRSDPPLPLTRLRVRNQLTELRNHDLRFSDAEAAVFLNQMMGLNLSPQDMAALERRTEGWIAGLQLAALSMRGRDDTEGFVRAFTGSHRYVIDYLAEEVLARQPEYVRNFLLHTSILNRLCGPLSDAMLNGGNGGGNPPGQEILEQLEQANLFLIPLDDNRRWYRYHHLFADFLRETLQQTLSAEDIAGLHRRAGEWYAQNELATEAIYHLLAAGDVERAIHFIERSIITLLAVSEVTTISNWLDALKPAVIRARPRLSLAQGWIQIIRNQWETVEPWLLDAEAGLEKIDPDRPESWQGWNADEIQGLRGEAAAMRAIMYGVTGNPHKSVELCRQALSILPQNSPIARSIILMTLGTAYEAIGDLGRAAQSHTQAINLSRENNFLVITFTSMNNLADLKTEQGLLHETAQIHRQGMALSQQRYAETGRHYPMARWNHLGLAELYREWNNFDEAKRYLMRGLELDRQIGGGEGLAYLILARILQAEGDNAGALDAIEQSKAVVRGPQALPWAQAVQARLWLAQGNVPAAAQWVQSCKLPTGDDIPYIQFPGEYGILARILVVQEQFEQARTLLHKMRAAAETPPRAGRLVEVLMLQALLHQAEGRPEAGLEPLVAALKIGQAGGYVRLFADEGPPMAALLRLAKSRGVAPHPAYVDQLLGAIERRGALLATAQTAPSANQQLIEPLSDRELEVLHRVAEGLSNREIAERLYITVGTTKTHTINIYRKLNVNSRTQAVARAQELGLLK